MTKSPGKPDAHPPLNLVRSALLGAFVSLVASILWAGIVGLCFRFPVPFVGIRSGPSAFVGAMIGAILYLVVGGALPQAAAGLVGGACSYFCREQSGGKSIRRVLLFGAASALPGVLLLSVLDWIVGPW